MAMQQRERVLAIGLGLIVCLFLLYWGFGRYRSMFTSREALLKSRRDDVTKFETKQAKINRDIARRKELEKRSLPSQWLAADRLYHEFLHGLVTGKLTNPSVAPRQVQFRAKGYDALGFIVTGEGTLEQIARVLYDFYSANHLHQIRSLSIDPQEKTGTLKLDMHVDALILPGVKRADSLSSEPGDNLVLEGFDNYKTAIVGRNLFAEYKPPAATPTPEPPKPDFDKAKLAYFTTIVEVDGRPQTWLVDRGVSKQTELYEGDEFDVAGVKGKVKRIDFDAGFVELEIDGKPVTVRQNKSLGDTLADAKKSN
jgi:hypothetical protein